MVVCDHKVTNLKATHNLLDKDFVFLLCCLWSQSYEFESNSQPDLEVRQISVSCLWSQSYEFESNSQLFGSLFWNSSSCLWSQSYEFESNSQQRLLSRKKMYCCLWSQSYEFESNSQQGSVYIYHLILLFVITKLRIWKQLTTG